MHDLYDYELMYKQKWNPHRWILSSVNWTQPKKVNSKHFLSLLVRLHFSKFLRLWYTHFHSAEQRVAIWSDRFKSPYLWRCVMKQILIISQVCMNQVN